MATHLTKVDINVYINGKRHHKHRKLRLESFGPVSEQDIPPGPRGEKMTGSFSDSQKVVLTYANPKDKKGEPATVQKGSLVWKVEPDNGTVSVVPISEDPPSASVVMGHPGVCEVWPTADADLGDNVETIEGERTGIQVTAGKAVAIGSPVFGAPEEQ